MSQFSADDFRFMAHALRLAEQGLYTTSPNPRVGCVVVQHGAIVGSGAHLKAGEPHAEVYALREARAQAKNATLYVTLEPCSHTGKTPPCADAVIASGVSRVVVAMQDPNPLVAGRGLARIAAQGITVECGLMEAQAKALNAGFISRMTRQRPFLRSKVAASLDGKTALLNGQSQWITSEHARNDVQQWRAQACAILTGSGTVLADNPQLNVRTIATSRQPLRVIVDTYLRTPPTAHLAAPNTLIAYVYDEPSQAQGLQASGAELLQLPESQGKVDLSALLQALAQRGVNEVLCEAGTTLNGNLLAQGLVDELLLYYAPCLMGHQAHGMFDMPALESMPQRVKLEWLDVRQIGPDIRIRAKPLFL